jgi:hypothetical protein
LAVVRPPVIREAARLVLDELVLIGQVVRLHRDERGADAPAIGVLPTQQW